MQNVPFDFTLPEPESNQEDEHFNPEPVMEPHVHDVLCGRGGLTNHHPGNSWYRRLVRSNRPLYRTSPKHTKLLVAKAIVHHVQSQNPPGRFLEVQRSSGLWLPVSYKKAVDKTSQGLREKDRENEGITDTHLISLKDVPAAPPVLQELARSSADGKKPRNIGKEYILHPHPSTEAAAAKAPPALQQTASWFWRNNNKKQKTAEADPLPLPTEPLTQRASSIFRFFTNSKLMEQKQPEPAASNNFADNSLMMNSFHNQQNNNTTSSGYQQQTNMINSGFDQSLEPTQLPPPGASIFATGTGTTQLMKPQLMGDPLVGSSAASSLHSIDPLPLGGNDNNKKKRTRDSFENPPAAGAPVEETDAPSLTRLTTQVSDWLQSFWPLGDERNRQLQNTMQNNMQNNMQANMQNNMQNNNMQNNINAHEMQRQLINMSNSLSALQQQMQGNNNVMTTDQIEMQMQQLQQMRDTMDRATAAPPPPPDLQPSVSSTILQLASSPSRLFAGLSTFFSDNNKARGISQVMSNPAGNGGMMVNVGNDTIGGMPGNGMPGTGMAGPGMPGAGTGMPGAGMAGTGMPGTGMPGAGFMNGGMNGMNAAAQAQPTAMMESNNSAGVMPPPPLGMASFGVGHVNGGSFNNNMMGNSNNGHPNFGRKSSGRSLLDD